MKKIFGLYLRFPLVFILLGSLLVNSQQPNVDGEWSDPIPFGIVPVAVANLPDGRLLTWSSQFRNTFIEEGDGATFSQFFDPFGGVDGNGGVDGPEFTMNTDHDMFCPGINNLPDGRLLSAGGTTSTRTSIFNPQTGLWTVASEMNIPRGYQGNITMADGNVFTVGGSWSEGASNNGGKDAEIWSPTTGWITLPNIQGEDIYTINDLGFEVTQGMYRVDNHVWLWTAPGEPDKVFHAGPSEQMHWIDPYATDANGNFVGAITAAGLRSDAGVTDTYSMKGNTVMFDTGKILKVGGATQYGVDFNTTTPAKSNSFVIDLNGVNYPNPPNVTYTGEMEYERIYQNSTVLPDGKVLVTGGSTVAALFSDTFARLEAEIFDPEATGNHWTTVGSMSEPRTYHSVAILMTDGRVFVGGGGLCDGSNPNCENHFNAEIYSPPYLFDSNGDLATRPEITNITANGTGTQGETIVNYNSFITVTTDVSVDEFSLVRFSAATHSTNNEQRRIPLATTSGTNHSLSIPDRDILPPGFYMLFALDSNGVPSISKTLRIGNALPFNNNNPNVVLELKFDETSGTSVADSSGNNNNGTIIEREDDGTSRTADDHQFVPGLFGNAIELDGLEFRSNSIIDIPNSTSFQSLTDKVTISAWVYRDANSIVQEGPFAGKVGNTGVISHDYPANFFGFHNTLYKWSFRTTTSFVDTYSGYAPLAGWNHIVGTYDGQQVVLYANGVEVSRKAITGNLDWRDDGTDYSSITASGFYDHRYDINNPPAENPADPSGNLSGITDEVDGKIDQLVIYSVALGAEEVANLYREGVAQGNPDVTNCEGNYITFEYKIGAGNWNTNSFNRIVANEGDEVFIRAKDFSGQYFVTTQIIDGPTFDSQADLNAEGAYQIDTGPGTDGDGLVDANDSGLYVLTTADGCPTAIELEVLGSCDPGETEIITQYNINGAWSSGANQITLDEGDRLIISALPDEDQDSAPYPLTIKLPNGITTGDNYTIESLNKGMHEGEYVLISNEGCSQVLEVIINQEDCNTLGLQTEYQINTEGFITGATEVDVFEGDNLTLSIFPNDKPYSIVSNSVNGNSKPNGLGDLTITGVTPDDAGLYTFTTASGCSVQLQVNVEVDCAVLNLQSQYRINEFGDFVVGASQVSIDEGSTITLSILPDQTAFSISSTSVNGNSKSLNTEDLTITNLTTEDAGIYTFTTTTGCEVELELIVNVVDCNDLGLQTEYEINDNGNFVLGEDLVRVNEGDDVLLSVFPNDYNGNLLAFSITGPNGNDKPLNPEDLILQNIQEADEGLYTMTTSSGCQVELLVLVGANADPVADATADPVQGIASLEVNFDGSGSTDDVAIESYLWDFGDGNTSTEINPTYIYDTPGEYTVTLTVTDNEGAIGNTTLTITVDAPNEAPVAVATANPLSGTAPLNVQFTGSGSTDDNGIATYSWDFGDGNTSVEADPAHTYIASGVYTAVLTVTDDQGETDTAQVIITVNEAPIAQVSANPTSGTAPLSVQFTGSGSTDDIGIVSFSWDFGDGNGSNQADPAHTYTSGGTFIAVLTVTDEQGATDTAQVVITVNEAPTAVAQATPIIGTVPLEVTFDSSSSSDDQGIESYSWDFGNGDTSTQENPVYTFTVSGTYTVTLTVIDGEGAEGTDTVIITVETPDNSAPIAEASATPLNGLVPLDVSFSSQGSSDDKGIVSYSWDFGDGNSSNDENPQHTYTQSGTFTATLTVTDEEGLQGIDTVIIEVQEPENEAPNAVASATPLNGLVPLDVSFSSQGSSDDKGIVSYSWDFGDGNSSTDENPQHTYTQSGTFTATLTVTDEEGLQGTDTLVITVETPDNSAPIASASATPLSGLLPLDVSFSSQGSSDDKGIVSYSWDFGDGNSSTDENPQHTYTQSGTFTATLTVTDEEGLQGTDTVIIEVQEPENEAPNAVASATPLSGLLPLDVSFSSQGSSDDKGIVSYSWDFGDGNSSTDENPQHTYTQSGTFTATLTVTDEEGLQGTDTVIIEVQEPENEAPNAVASATPLNGLVPLDVSFSSQGSSDDKGIVSYSWDFGDGNSSTDENPQHTYTQSGTFTAILTVTDEEGLQGTDTLVITVETPENQAPTAQADATPLVGSLPLEVSFSSAGSADDKGITAYFWDFGDGNSSTQENPKYTFTETGSFTVTLTVTDEEGLQGFDSLVIVVESPTNEAPNAVANATPLSGLAPLDVAFSSEGSTDDKGISTYSWDFGDGNTSTKQNPEHTYTQVGNFVATLTVMDEEGLQSSSSLNITVETVQNSAPIAVLEATVLTGEAPLEVGFSSKKSSDDKGIASYTWNFGDGTTSNEPNPMHTFEEIGTYRVTLLILDEEGLKGSGELEIIVAPSNDTNSNDNLVAIIPNPVRDGVGNLYISKPDGSFPIKIGLFDSSGRLVFTYVPSDILVDQVFQMPLGTIRDGLYFVRIDYDNGNSESVRLLVKN